jgi:hypothetical protein
LNCDPPINVEMLCAARSEFRNNLSRSSGHLFHAASTQGR